MKERPILMRAEMVRASRSGAKTQTRRLIDWVNIFKQSGCTNGKLAWSNTFLSWAVFDGDGEATLGLVKCPYGDKGDRLWVKETFLYRANKTAALYRADLEPTEAAGASGLYGGWKPSIFMPRKFSRLTLEIESVRVERLRDISEEDAKAEGAAWLLAPISDEPQISGVKFNGHKCGFARLWESINGKGSWDLNPFVWAITFRKL